MISRPGPLIYILSLSALMILFSSRFMLVRVRENSMAPTLIDGQWVLVVRGSQWVSSGDIALFRNPEDRELTIKRCVLTADDKPFIQNGWLKTQWGDWFLTESEWEQFSDSPDPPSDSFFMVGDNQYHSLDSRKYGYVRKNLLVGKVLKIHG